MKNITKEGIDNYAQHRIPCGDFLTAVLANDLMGALGRADDENRKDIFEICSYVYSEIPSICYGSYKIVKAWLAEREENENKNVIGEER